MCAKRTEQSPIDIVKSAMVMDEDLPALDFNYAGVNLSVTNNGHTVKAALPEESKYSLTIGDKSYQLLQFHFHTGSENLVEGEEYPIEMHLVHKSAEGAPAVS